MDGSIGGHHDVKRNAGLLRTMQLCEARRVGDDAGGDEPCPGAPQAMVEHRHGIFSEFDGHPVAGLVA